MAGERSFDEAFRILRKQFPAKTRRAFLEDIRGQLEESEEISAILSKQRGQPRYLAVTFDRKKNDALFSYSYFDMLLVALDALSGGNGIYKPSNQMRALRWNGTRINLLQVLRYVRRYNNQINFRRALILPFPRPPVGYHIDQGIHMK